MTKTPRFEAPPGPRVHRRFGSLGIVAALVALIVTACTTPVVPAVTNVSIDQADFSLMVGEVSVALTATVEFVGAASDEVTWSSDAPSVATVDPVSGEVTAVAEGTAEITATSTFDDTKSDSITVTVVGSEPAVTSVTIDQDDQALQVGASATLSATVLTVDGASAEVTWSSDAPSVATVDPVSGEVTAVAEGTAEITATSTFDDTKSDSITVTVTTLPATSISGLTAAIVLGSQVELTWTAANATGIDVVCFDGVEQLIDSLDGAASGTTMAIPPSDCQTIRVYARGLANDADVETVLQNVVLNGGDDGPGSLRDLVASAAPGAVLGFASDVPTVTLSTVFLQGGVDAHLFLTNDVTISGPASAPVTVRGDDTLEADASGAEVLRSRIFYVPTGETIHLDGVVVTGGVFIGRGAGVRNDGDLLITNSVFEGNRAWYFGGAISNNGTLRIEDSELRNNVALVTAGERAAPYLCIGDPDRTCELGDVNYISAPTQGGSGGALANLELSGTVELVRTLITGNSAVYSGGGIYVQEGSGSVTLTDSDVVGNTASDSIADFATRSYGGGVANVASFTMTGGVVENNVSAEDGGGLANGTYSDGTPTMELSGVTVTGNDAQDYGGGVVNYYAVDTSNLTVSGGTSIAGNTAGVAGEENRSDIGPVPLAVTGASVSAFDAPNPPEDHLRR